jgi:cell division protein FtsA
VLAEIIESRMREIATMTKQQIEKSGLYAMLPGGVVLTGGGAMLAGTDKLFEAELKHLRVRVAVPEIPARFGPDPGAAVALGLARFALQCYDELSPAAGPPTDWKDRVRSLFSMMSGR